jgi:hypothetical protein
MWPTTKCTASCIPDSHSRVILDIGNWRERMSAAKATCTCCRFAEPGCT